MGCCGGALKWIQMQGETASQHRSGPCLQAGYCVAPCNATNLGSLAGLAYRGDVGLLGVGEQTSNGSCHALLQPQQTRGVRVTAVPTMLTEPITRIDGLLAMMMLGHRPYHTASAHQFVTTRP